MAEAQTLTVCRLGAAEWQTYRSIRLAMLKESPSAFGGTYDQAAGDDEQVWKQRLTDSSVLLARVGPAPAGSAVYSVSGTSPGDCGLYGMWVDPRFRRAGVARALIGSVIEQALAAGRRRVVLDVVAGNDAARTVYERAGFVATGHRAPYVSPPRDELLTKVEMELVVDEGLVRRSSREVSLPPSPAGRPPT
jgi:ribosomal protein S18 acetylase RimI-like enzyme